jgi:hypothetical protein
MREAPVSPSLLERTPPIRKLKFKGTNLNPMSRKGGPDGKLVRSVVADQLHFEKLIEVPNECPARDAGFRAKHVGRQGRVKSQSSQYAAASGLLQKRRRGSWEGYWQTATNGCPNPIGTAVRAGALHDAQDILRFSCTAPQARLGMLLKTPPKLFFPAKRLHGFLCN